MPGGNIFDVARAFKRSLIAREQKAVGEIRRYYRHAQEQIVSRLQDLLRQIEEWQQEHPGEDMPVWWLFERDRLGALQAQMELELERFAGRASARIEREQGYLVRRAERDAEVLATMGLGTLPAGVAVSWVQLATPAVEQMVGHLQDGSPLRELLDKLGLEASEKVRQELVTGLVLGRNPRDVARRCYDALQGSRVRAETIARTEMLRAYREATRESYQANSDIVRGWMWVSACDVRTCPMCWAMHGTIHSLDERLDDHPRGRCTMVPVVRSLADMGYAGMPEPRMPAIEPGEAAFARLPEARQRAILGDTAYEAYRDGVITLRDLVGQRISPRWGSMRYTRSLREIVGPMRGRGGTYAIQR